MLVGRNKELNLLHSILTDDKSHFVAIYGRRRVGKTFLIHDLQTASKTRSAIFPLLVTTYGMVANSRSGAIQSVITMDDLFKLPN